MPVLGGLSSARTLDGAGGAVPGPDGAASEGAVGVWLDGVEMLPCVSQGAAPLGRELTITAAEGNVIHELAGRPAVETIEQVIAELPIARARAGRRRAADRDRDRRRQARVRAGRLPGPRRARRRPRDRRGRRRRAASAPGQVVRLHARDARSADEDLRRELRLRAQAIGGRPPAGALVFSCNGRGQAMFGACDHDATMVGGGARRRAGGRVLRRRRDRAGRRAQLPARVHRDGRRVPAADGRRRRPDIDWRAVPSHASRCRRHRAGHRRHRRDRAGDRPRAGRPRGAADAHRPPDRGACRRSPASSARGTVACDLASREDVERLGAEAVAGRRRRAGRQRRAAGQRAAHRARRRIRSTGCWRSTCARRSRWPGRSRRR